MDQTDYLLASRTIAPGGSASVNSRLFAGAKEGSIIDGYHQQLGLNKFDLLIDWGWFYFIIKPIFLAMDFFFRLVHNYGIAILMLMVVVKLSLFPLANKYYTAMVKRKVVGPLGKNKQVPRVIRCLYVAIQTLVYYSVFKVLLVAVEIRHAPFFGWTDDLSVPDPSNIFDLFGLIPFDPTTFPVLGPLLRIGIWPAMMCATLWAIVKLNPPPADPTQKVILNWTPIIAAYGFGSAAAGLVVCWVWNNLLSLLHQILIIHRHGAKILLLNDLRPTFAKPRPNRPLADFVRIWWTRSGRASPSVSVSIWIVRSIRRASRITFWLSLVFYLLISTRTDGDWLIGLFMVTAFLAIVVYLIALRLGQMLAGREFAAALAGDLGRDRPIILFLRSFDVARSSLAARFRTELGYIVRASFNIGIAGIVADTFGFVDRRYEVEEHLDDAIGPNAMFVAIGDRIASYGAAKITVKEQDWQETFYRLANASQLIFMMPGPSAALLWELSQIARSRSLLGKTVFIMPRKGWKRSLVGAWQKTTDMAAELGVSLPFYFNEGCYFRLSADGHPGETVALEPFTRALRKFMTSPASKGVIGVAEILKLV